MDTNRLQELAGMTEGYMQDQQKDFAKIIPKVERAIEMDIWKPRVKKSLVTYLQFMQGKGKSKGVISNSAIKDAKNIVEYLK